MKRRLALVLVAILVVGAVFVYMANRPNEEVEIDVETHIYQFMINNGFSDIQASAILAEIKMNSNFNPTATSPNDKCYGLLQWATIRRERLEMFADEIGKPIDEVDTQLLFFLEEVNPESKYYALFPYQGYEWSDFENATSPREAAEALCMVYSRCRAANLEFRGDVAVQYWEDYNSLN